MKTCKTCNIEKQFNYFNIAKENKDGHSNMCKLCKCEYSKNYRNKNKKNISKQRKEFYKNNRNRLLTRDEYHHVDAKACTVCKINKPIIEFNKNKCSKDGHRFECKLCQTKKYEQYYKNNSNKSKTYRIANKKKINLNRKNKRNTNIQYKLQCALRTRLWGAIKYVFKSGSAVSDLGCTINEFKKHIESQFTENMSWDNWGLNTWHLDHKTPLASFDLTNRDQFLMAVHYTNIQPLLAIDNLKKGCKI